MERILKSIPSRERPNMADLAAGLLQRQMESLFDGGVVAGLSDRELLVGNTPSPMREVGSRFPP